jgi:putative hemolysin
MALTYFLIFALFLLLSAFFSASETAFISTNPYTLDSLDQKGSRRARLIKRYLGEIDQLLAAILIGNTLVNMAAASVATLFFLSVIPDQREAALIATLAATLVILFFGEINPKTFAAYHPVKVSMWLVQPLRLFIVLFFPLAKALTFASHIFVRRSAKTQRESRHTLNEEEIRILLARGVTGMSALRKRMIGGVLDIGSRPVREIIVPRTEVRAIEINSPFDQLMETVLSSEYSRLPVYRGRMDNVEGLIHTKDLIPYLVNNKEFSITALLRRPVFVPESASIEKVMIQMQESAVHLAFVVDEFGTLDGIVTLEDIIEEIVGDIRDEYDEKAEDWFQALEPSVYIVKGNASLKELCQRLPLCLPQKASFSTLAGFLLHEFGRIPREKDTLEFQGHKFIVERLTRRHISLVRVIIKKSGPEDAVANRRLE